MCTSLCLSDRGADERPGEDQTGAGCHQSAPCLDPAVSGWERSTPGQPPPREEETARGDLGDEVSHHLCSSGLCCLPLRVGKEGGLDTWRRSSEKISHFWGVPCFFSYSFGASLCAFFSISITLKMYSQLLHMYVCVLWTALAFTGLFVTKVWGGRETEALFSLVVVWVLPAVSGNVPEELGHCPLLSYLLFSAWLELTFSAKDTGLRFSRFIKDRLDSLPTGTLWFRRRDR